MQSTSTSCTLDSVNPCEDAVFISIVIAFLIVPQTCLLSQVFDEKSCFQTGVLVQYLYLILLSFGIAMGILVGSTKLA